MLYIIKKILTNNKEAEETLIAVFVYLFNNLNQFNPKQNTFPIWLWNNARNIAIEKLCSQQKNDLGSNSFKTLPLTEKTVFVLHHFRSYSLTEISTILPLSLSMVERLLQSAEIKVEKNSYALEEFKSNSDYLFSH